MTSVAVGLSAVRHMESMPSESKTANSYGITGDIDVRLESSHRLVISAEDMRKYVLNLLEDLQSFVNEDNSDHKYCNELIARLCYHLMAEASRLDEDSPFRQQMDVYCNLLRNILRNPKLNPISRTMILEVLELRAADWLASQHIDGYYRKKMAELEANDAYGSVNGLNRGLKTSQSSGSLNCSSVGNDVLKPSGKLIKPVKVSGKAFLKDEVVIRNGDSGTVNPGAKERPVQITGPAEENIERAKELIKRAKELIKRLEELIKRWEEGIQRVKELIKRSEELIKRNASAVPFECPNRGFDPNLNQSTNEFTQNEMTEQIEANSIDKSGRTSAESEHKMAFTFTVEFDTEVIRLATNNYSIGLKAQHLLQQLLVRTNRTHEILKKYESSDSDDNLNDKQKENISPTDPQNNPMRKEISSIGWKPEKKWSIAQTEPNDQKVNQIQRSSSQGTVPIGRTSLRFMSAKVPKRVANEPNGKITYDRLFLLSCRESPLSRTKPNIDIMAKIWNKTPAIVRNSGAQQNSSSSLNTNQILTQNNGIENW